MSSAWELDLPAARKLVLLCYADFANDLGECWPANKTVARKCGMNVRTVQRCLSEFADDGLLFVKSVQGRTNKVTLDICADFKRAELAPEDRGAEEVAEPAPRKRKGVTESHTSGVTESHGGVTQLSRGGG